tara:strand:- start:583 stop:774 length:192 start_codon:yes stop_codon:yes gene_type:complete
MSDGLQMKYFVLKPKGDDVFARASRIAMLQYAREIEMENATFAEDIRAWVKNEAMNAEAQRGS